MGVTTLTNLPPPLYLRNGPAREAGLSVNASSRMAVHKLESVTEHGRPRDIFHGRQMVSRGQKGRGEWGSWGGATSSQTP